MKRIMLAAIVTIAASIVPTGAHAKAALNYECSGTVKVGHAGSCSVEFTAQDGRMIPLIGSGANFDDLLARGPLTLDWTDANGKTVVSYGCFGSGIPGQGTIGDTRAALCTQFGPLADAYTSGPGQHMVVRAWPTYCPGDPCTFHGSLHLADPFDATNP
jgi:hypothetical protein